MRNRMYKSFLAVSAVAVFIGVGAYAFAHMGGGYGGYGMMHGGPMMHQNWYGGSGYGAYDDLSEEDFRALDRERRAFFDATEDIRQEIYSRELKLQSELAKANPDTDRAAALQGDISRLAAKLERMRVDHMIKVRKINPDAGRAFAGTGPMMGYGGYGRQGSCW